MATDNTQPRVGLIFQIGIGTIVVLCVLRAALGAYFDKAMQWEQTRKIGRAPAIGLTNLRADEKARLTEGPLPIEKAMGMLASQGRKAMSPELMPTTSKDIAPLQGWMKLPSDVPPPMLATPVVGVAAADGGLSGADGAAPATAPSADAGVKKNKP